MLPQCSLVRCRKIVGLRGIPAICINVSQAITSFEIYIPLASVPWGISQQRLLPDPFLVSRKMWKLSKLMKMVNGRGFKKSTPYLPEKISSSILFFWERYRAVHFCKQICILNSEKSSEIILNLLEVSLKQNENLWINYSCLPKFVSILNSSVF